MNTRLSSLLRSHVQNLTSTCGSVYSKSDHLSIALGVPKIDDGFPLQI